MCEMLSTSGVYDGVSGDIHDLYVLRLRHASRVGQRFAAIKFVLYRLLHIGPAISAQINGVRMWATEYPALPREKANEGQ